MNEVLPEIGPIVTTHRSGRGIDGICRSHHGANHLPRLVWTLDDGDEGGRSGDERYEFAEKWAVLVLGVVLLRDLVGDDPKVARGDL